MKPLHIDVVIPFCSRRCAHCARPAVTTGADAERRAAYLHALREEVDATAPDLAAFEAASIHIGGGTPQAVPARELAGLVAHLRTRLAFATDARIAVDTMPGRLTRADLHAYRAAGIDALLVNLVTTQGAEHAALGRPCDVGDGRPLFQMFEQEGFLGYGASLAVGLPHQSAASFARTLADAFCYAPKFFLVEKAAAAGLSNAPGPRELAAMREKVRALLAPNAFAEVAPGVWALPGYGPAALAAAGGAAGADADGTAAAGGTVGAGGTAAAAALAAAGGAAGIDVVGFGLGARSRYDGMWYENTCDLDAYIAAQGDPARTMARAGTYAIAQG